MNFTWSSASPSEQLLFNAISLLLNHEERLLLFLFDPREPKLRKRAGILKEDAWNLETEDQLLVRAALDIWSGSGHLALWECLEQWESIHWIQLIRCLLTLKTLKAVDLAP